MADLNVERKSPSVWPWIIGLLVLALLIWALVELFESDDETATLDPAPEQAAVVEPVSEPVGPDVMVASLPVAEISQSPDAYAGQTVSGQATVAEVPSQGGFWIDDRGQRLFVVMTGQATEAVPTLTPGQTIHIADATVARSSELDARAAEVSPDVRQTAEGEEVVLLVDPANLHPTEQGTGQPANDPVRPR